MVNNRLRLASRRDVEHRLELLTSFYKEQYGEVFFIGEKAYDPRDLILTQDYLESDKLAVVLKAVLWEGYSVPIIVVSGKNGGRYVIDGHHRVLVYAWLRRKILGYTLLIPRYKPRVAKTLLEVNTVNPLNTPVELFCWRHIVNTIRFLEKHHETLAEVWLETLPVKLLKPTEPPIHCSPKPHELSLKCPILIYKFNEEYYVVDGHHRVCTKLLANEEEIPAIVFTLSNKEIGIVKTARAMGYAEFNKKYCEG
ncbi:MAG: chromosome partitioning protein ParB [Desulfurococcaceae archaeon]